MSEYASIVNEAKQRSEQVMHQLLELADVQSSNINTRKTTKEFVEISTKYNNETDKKVLTKSASASRASDVTVKELYTNLVCSMLKLNAQHPEFLEHFSKSFARFASLNKNEVKSVCTKPEFKWLFNNGRSLQSVTHECNNTATSSVEPQCSMTSVNNTTEIFNNNNNNDDDDNDKNNDSDTDHYNTFYPDALKDEIHLHTRWPRMEISDDDDDDDDDSSSMNTDNILIAPHILRQISLEVAETSLDDYNKYNGDKVNKLQQFENKEFNAATYLFHRWAEKQKQR